jgi:hypothetical protein
LIYIPVTIFDNFLNDPDSVRNFALETEYHRSPGHYPGLRSDRLDVIAPELERDFSKKVIETVFDTHEADYSWKIESSFQSIPEKFKEGWVHDDTSPDGWNIAGILYLNPSAPMNSGTSIYKTIPGFDYRYVDIKRYSNIKHKFFRGEYVSDYDQERNYFNSLFRRTVAVENIYNRLLVYSASELHKADFFFGNNIADSRLTLMFYMNVSKLEKGPTDVRNDL